MAGRDTLLASAARTASVDSADFTSTAQAAHFIVNVTAVVATPSVVFTIQGKDDGLDIYYDLLVSNAITATGATVLKIGPGLTASPNAAAADFLPDTFRVKAVHGDADSITYSVSVLYGE